MMNNGNQLIDDLLKNPESFRNDGRTYELLQEYYKGLPLNTLKKLLHHHSKPVRMSAVWIVSELGADGEGLIDDMITLLDENDRYIKYHVIESIGVCAFGKNADKFINLLINMESEDEVIRNLVLRIISNTDVPQLFEILDSLKTSKVVKNEHIEGISLLCKVDTLDKNIVRKMLKSDNSLTRKYGIILSKKMCKKHPELISEALSNDDADIVRFAIEVKKIASI